MATRGARDAVPGMEWQTLGLIMASYGIWGALLFYGHGIPPLIWLLASALNLTLFMSITHEVVHGHPTRNARLNRLLILLPIGWSLPYERFRDTHIDHHETHELTDPFDDPESWYLAHYAWMDRNWFSRSILDFNNTLSGRMLIGPMIGLFRFYQGEVVSILLNTGQGRNRLAKVWLLHVALCGFLLWMVNSFSQVSAWVWLASIYLGHSMLLIRTFLEHQAAPDFSQRTVIIERACPIAFLFLFNNYHFVHHARPHIPWYRLPAEFRREKQRYIEENGAYVYPSYADIFRRYFFTVKEPVPHPFLRTAGKAP